MNATKEGYTTVRGTDGKILATVWGATAGQRDRTGTLRAMQDSPIGTWVRGQVQRITVAGGDVPAWLDQVVSISNEYTY